VFTITEIALKITNTVPPADFVSGASNMAYLDSRRRRPSGAPLTFLRAHPLAIVVYRTSRKSRAR